MFDLWQRVDTEQSRWGRERKLPPLLSGFGTSLVERAMIEAFCRATAHDVRRRRCASGQLGVRLDALHPELRSRLQPKDLLPPAPLRSIIARHTVGLLDPLTDDEIAPADRVDDGLPQSLDACIRAYGLTHFKLKLGGDPRADAERLRAHRRRARAARRGREARDHARRQRELPRGRARSRAVAASSAPTRSLQPLFSRALLFLEQPFPRDVALADDDAQVDGGRGRTCCR